MKVAILTSKNQWFVPYAKKLGENLDSSSIFYNHQDIKNIFDIVFILSYHEIINTGFLNRNRHNIVIHASDLPKGKGWAPMFWQILEGKNEIPFSMFEASDGVDNGDIYMNKTLKLSGFELNEQLRKKQANFIIEMCLDFVHSYEKYKKPKKQNGNESFYSKRLWQNSKLDIDKTIRDQFNLFRIVDNENYPAFFEMNNRKFILKIEEFK